MSEGRGGGMKAMWFVLVAVFVVILLLQEPPERPYDLASPGPQGYKGLSLLLEGSGTEIDAVDASEIGADSVERYPVAFVPVPEGAVGGTIEAWRSYAEAGGRLVLGLGSSLLGAPAAAPDDDVVVFGIDEDGYAERRPGRCDVPDLQVDGLGVVRWFPSSQQLRVRGRAGCFGTDRRALVASTPVGAGEIVNLASPDLFTNQLMGAPEVDETVVRDLPDNGVVAQALLGRGTSAGAAGTLAVVTSGVAVAPDGDKSLNDFLPLGVKLGIAEIVVAVLVYAVAKGRRHGRVVEEPVPVSLAGSSFTAAVGDLLERQGDHQRAAAALRHARCRELAERLGLPLDIDPARLAAVLAERTGREVDEVVQILTGAVVDDGGLVELCRSLDSLRQEAVHV